MSQGLITRFNLKLKTPPTRAELDSTGDNTYAASFGVPGSITRPDTGGPFDIPPELATIGIIQSVGAVMKNGSASMVIKWEDIVAQLDGDLRASVSKMSPTQTLPACIRITGATIGDNEQYRNMCHIRLRDASDKLMTTKHMYRADDGNSDDIGFPLHLLTEDGGILLEEPQQLTNTFKHYWYISKSMLTCSAFQQQSTGGMFYSIPRSSDAAKLMYYVLVVKNGKYAMDPADNVTNQDNVSFTNTYADRNDDTCWRFPEITFKEVSALLADKLAEVKKNSYDCTRIKVNIDAFSVFRETLASKGNVPVLITLEIDIHLPLVSVAPPPASEIPEQKAPGARHRTPKQPVAGRASDAIDSAFG